MIYNNSQKMNNLKQTEIVVREYPKSSSSGTSSNSEPRTSLGIVVSTNSIETIYPEWLKGLFGFFKLMNETKNIQGKYTMECIQCSSGSKQIRITDKGSWSFTRHLKKVRNWCKFDNRDCPFYY
jgi:hypothetical protein